MANTPKKDNETNEEFLARRLKEFEEEFERLNAINIAEEQLDDHNEKAEKALPKKEPPIPSQNQPPASTKEKKKKRKRKRNRTDEG